MAISQNILLSIHPAASGGTAYSQNNNITINSTPANLTAGENPIVWTLNTSAITSSNDYAQIAFSVSGVPPDAEYFTLTPDESFQFPNYQLTAADEPQANEFYSTGTTPSKTTTDVADCIVASLNGNYSFRQRFFAVRTGTQVIIKSLKKGSRYNLNFTSTTGYISLDYTLDAGNQFISQNKKDYSVWADIYIDSDGYIGGAINRFPSVYLTSTDLTYLPNNAYTFDVSNVVKSYVSTPLPEVGNTSFWLTLDDMVNFYIVFGEEYDEFENNNKRRFTIGQTEVKWATNASLPLNTVNNLSDNLVLALYNGTQSINAMTDAPNPKETFSSQKEFISFVYYHTPSIIGDIKFFLKGYYELFDGTQVVYTHDKITNISQGGSYHVETSYESMPFSPSSAIRLYTAEVWTSFSDDDGGTHEFKIINQRVYNVVQDCLSDYAQQFAWKNSRGRWDTFLFNGEIEENLERSAKQFNSPESYSPVSTDRLITTTKIDISQVITAKSGWIDKYHFDYLFYIAKNQDVRLFDSNGDYIPVNVKKLDWKLDSTKTLYQVQMDYILARGENYVKQ